MRLKRAASLDGTSKLFQSDLSSHSINGLFIINFPLVLLVQANLHLSFEIFSLCFSVGIIQFDKWNFAFPAP